MPEGEVFTTCDGLLFYTLRVQVTAAVRTKACKIAPQ